MFNRKSRICLFVCLVGCFTIGALTLSGQNLSTLKNQKPLRLSSGLSVNFGGYAAEGIPNRRMPFTWAIQGTPVLEVYGVKLPFLISFSNQQRSFHQPFNQFGVTPTWRWVKVHLGYSNARFSNYTLAGRRFLGAGVELTPGKWRIGFVGGRFQKAIEFDSTAVRQSGIYPSNVPVPAFSRFGYAAKLGYGGKRSFAEISILKAKDNAQSIPESYKDVKNLNPEENFVIGLNTQVTLFKKLVWTLEAAASAYTRNQTMDEVNFENQPQLSFLHKIIPYRNSTQLFSAGETSLGYTHKYFGIQARYRRVDADFKSMGAFFFQTDIEQFTFSPSIRLFKSKVVLNGSIGVQRNNLSGARIHTTERIISSFSGSINPKPKYGMTFSISNFGVTQVPNTNLMSSPTYDTLQLAQVARAIQVAPFLRLGSSKLRQTITLSIQANQMYSQNDSPTSALSAMKTIGGNIQYQISNHPSKFNAQAGLNYQKVMNAFLTSYTQGINVGAGKGWGDFSINGSAAFYQNILEEKGKGSTIQLSMNTQYKLRKGISWSTRASLIKANRTSQPSFVEFYWNTGLTCRF